MPRHFGAFAGARRLKERALAIREKVLGPKHPKVATGLSKLAQRAKSCPRPMLRASRATVF
jgi:hypothetical protein